MCEICKGPLPEDDADVWHAWGRWYCGQECGEKGYVRHSPKALTWAR